MWHFASQSPKTLAFGRKDAKQVVESFVRCAIESESLLYTNISSHLHDNQSARFYQHVGGGNQFQRPSRGMVFRRKCCIAWLPAKQWTVHAARLSRRGELIRARN